MAQNAPTFHGINMAGDSYIENLAVESLLTNPTVTTGGKVWMLGTTDQALKFSYVDGVGAVQVSTFGSKEAIDAEATARATADTTLTNNLATEVTDRTNADTTLTNNLATEVTDRTNADTALQAAIDNIISNVDPLALDSLTEVVAAFQLADSNLNNAITTIAGDHDTDLAAEALARTNADAALQTELDTTQTGAGLTTTGTVAFTTFAPATMSVDFTATTSLLQAIEQINNELKVGGSDAIDTEVAARIAGDTALQTNIDDEEAARISADNTLQTNINTEITNRTNADAAIQTELDASQTAIGASMAADGTYVLDDSLATPVTNYLQDNATITEDIRDLDIVLKTTADAVDALELLATGSTQDIQDEIDATQTGAGLSIEGAYVVDSGADYIATATSLSNADSLLDDQIKVNTDGLATEVGARTTAVTNEATARTNADAAIQTELDATQTTVGASMAVDGTYVIDVSTATPVTTYLQDNASITEDIRDLDVVAKANADAIAAEVTARTNAVTTEATTRSTNDAAIQTELDASQATIGASMAADGSYVIDASAGAPVTTYLQDNATITEDIRDLDVQMKASADAIDALELLATGSTQDIQDELDAVELGSGLSTTGTYVVDAGSNYLTAATSLSNADSLLDDQVKLNEDGLATEITARTTAVTTEATTRSANDDSIIAQINSGKYAVASPAALSHVITHNLASNDLLVQVWVDQGDGSYANDIVPIAIDSNNQYTIYLSESRAIRTSAMRMDDIALV